MERGSDNLSASCNRRQLEFNRDKCKILNQGAEPSAGQDSKWKGYGRMTKQGRTHNTPKEFLQKYKSLVDPAEKRRGATAQPKESCLGSMEADAGCLPPGADWLTRDRGVWPAM